MHKDGTVGLKILDEWSQEDFQESDQDWMGLFVIIRAVTFIENYCITSCECSKEAWDLLEGK